MRISTSSVLSYILFFGLQHTANSFTTPLPSLVSKHSITRSTNTLLQSESNDADKTPETPLVPPPIMASTPTPAKDKSLDPLIASLTSPGTPPKEGTETKNIPLLGEIPVDGSLLVLVPAAGIAVIGFIMSIVVAFNSRDAFVDTLTNINPPPPKTTVVTKDCRGICSTQQDDLNDLRGFMEKISKRKVSDVSFAPPPEPPAPEPVVEAAVVEAAPPAVVVDAAPPVAPVATVAPVAQE